MLRLSKRAGLILASLGLCAALPAHAVLIDFDTLPGGGALAFDTNVSNEYAAVGAVFEAIEDGGAAQGVVRSLPGAPTQHWTNCAALGCPNRADILRITFLDTVENVSWQTNTQGFTHGAGIVFEAYSVADALLESVSVLGDFDAALGAFAASGIARIDILQPTDRWGFGIDNLSFDVVAVPEPGTITLLATGLLGLGFTRRRRS